jgi:protoheme IX farnesyltransferase
MFIAKMDYKATLRRYYLLSKPGIIRANVLSAVAGYLYASMFHIAVLTAFGLIGGIMLVIAGACAYNNYLDRGIDAHMVRTSKRGLVTGDISVAKALSYATLVTVIGFSMLVITQNRLTLALIALAFIDYVVLYGWSKRKSVHGTLVGCISGALPLVAGYTAVTNQLDLQAWLLFALMTAWQMAHFYAIALHRLKDYKAARIPVMPAVYGVATTKLQTIVYIVAFVLLTGSLAVWGDLGIIGGVVLASLGLWWLYRALHLYGTAPSDKWGLQVFIASLVVITGMSVTLAFGPLLV